MLSSFYTAVYLNILIQFNLLQLYSTIERFFKDISQQKQVFRRGYRDDTRLISLPEVSHNRETTSRSRVNSETVR